jgi:L-amino acid N-acyltransferase YncA
VAGSPAIRIGAYDDLHEILRIYNEGIEDRLATLETEQKGRTDIEDWWEQHDERYVVLVAAEASSLIGFASLNRFSHRCAHSAIADLSVYVTRSQRGRGIGFALLTDLLRAAAGGNFHKVVLHAINENERGRRLYRRSGFNEVGVFREHGLLDGRYVDVVAMERLVGDEPSQA